MMENKKQENMTIFLDAIGRVLLAEKVAVRCTEDVLVVKNPIIIHFDINKENGQLMINFFPIFFKEFQGDKAEGTVWSYNRKNITLCDPLTFDFRVYAQYDQMFSNNAVGQLVQQPRQNTAAPISTQENIIKLFDE